VVVEVVVVAGAPVGVIVVVDSFVPVVVMVVGRYPLDLDEMQGGVVEAVKRWQMEMMMSTLLRVTLESCEVMMERRRCRVVVRNGWQKVV
jgi:hypothetical protein